MNLDGKRSVMDILSSFCPKDVEVIGRQILSVEKSYEHCAEVVLDNFKQFTVCT